MCKTSYQHAHVSMEEADGEEEAKRMLSRTRRRCILFTGIVILVFAAFTVAIAVVLHQQDDQQAEYSSDDTIVQVYDDDFYKNTDDDSINYHGEPQVEDDKEMSLDMDGSRNLEKLSKATNEHGKVIAGCETTVLIMRHCEKEGDYTTDLDSNEHCDYLGLERTHWIPTLFGSNSRWPAPSYLYALSPKRGSHMVFRQIETLKPLADKFGLPIQSDYETNKDLVKDIFKLISTGQVCEKLIVVNWRHHMIPNLAAKMGCKGCPKAYPEDSFDQVWQLKFVWDVLSTEAHRRSRGELLTTSPSALRRQLKSKASKADTKKSKKKTFTGPMWSIYSFVTNQNFDPLQFSSLVGDYQGNGTEIGAQWLDFDEGEM